MTPLYALLIPMLGIAAYYVYQQRQAAQQSQNTRLNQELQIETLHSKVAMRDAEIMQLKQETTRTNSLFASFSNVVYDMVFVLGVDCTIIAHSASVTSLVEVQNLIGQKLCDVIVDPDLEAVLLHAIHEDEGFEEQFTLDNRYFRVQAQRYPVAGNQFFIGVAMQDITQLVRLNRARRDMVANISHELGTPVANIRIIIDSLFYDQSRPKRKASIASLRAIARETEALQWTVQELLDLSMIESGQAIVKLVDEQLLEIVSAAIERLDEKLDRKNLNIVRHVPEKIRVSCDRDHIRRVIVNLISNAIKWSPEDETITISATINGEYVIVRVFDNGPGVPDDQCERIFERFYQVDTARTGREGSGLGLAISKHIAEAHGGKIWAEGNSQGSGGRFLFTLLNRTPENVENGVMDRGQHDVVLNPYAAVTENGVADENDSIHHEDEGEIEFVDEDEWED